MIFLQLIIIKFRRNKKIIRHYKYIVLIVTDFIKCLHLYSSCALVHLQSVENLWEALLAEQDLNCTLFETHVLTVPCVVFPGSYLHEFIPHSPRAEERDRNGDAGGAEVLDHDGGIPIFRLRSAEETEVAHDLLELSRSLPPLPPPGQASAVPLSSLHEHERHMDLRDEQDEDEEEEGKEEMEEEEGVRDGCYSPTNVRFLTIQWA